MMGSNRVLFIAALFLFLGVAMGAFGAHALRPMFSAQTLSVYKTAVDYQMWHALGLGLIAVFLRFHGDSRLLRYAAWLMIVGICLFSGSLYVLCISGTKWLGMITPLGGVSLLAAWMLLMFFSLKTGSNESNARRKPKNDLSA